MACGLLTPFLRARAATGASTATAGARATRATSSSPTPRWSWTHGIEIDAPAGEVWRWVAQIGADRGGFYSYQWLENVAGCSVRNAERIHPEWEVRAGDVSCLHPAVPPLRSWTPWTGPHLRGARAGPDEAAPAAGRPWVAASWLFLVEPLGPGRCRLVSRYRCACSDDLRTRLAFGPALIEPIGFAMDRRMLLGVKERAERRPPLDAARR